MGRHTAETQPPPAKSKPAQPVTPSAAKPKPTTQVAFPTKKTPPVAVTVTQAVESIPLMVARPKPTPITNSAGLVAVTAPMFPVTPPPNVFPRPVRDPFEAQVALARRAISSGSIDGAIGSQTRMALRQFQTKYNLPVSGALDAPTRTLLTLRAPPITTYTVTADDLAQLQPLAKTWLEKSEQTSLAYETELELVAEHSHAHPLLIRKLNPGVDWANIAVGTTLQIPDVEYPEPTDKAAFVIIHLSGKYLEAFDATTNLLAHFPCSIAAHVEKRPVGLLHVTVIAPDPNYTFDPAVFPESPEAQAIGHKLILPAGPNNPVGVAWMGLDRPGYGMHGTPAPEQVGRTESHGCFRLANWDAAYMVKLVWVGLPVEVVP